MKKISLLFVILSTSFFSQADTIIIWECELENDSTLEDVKEANSKWLNSVNKISSPKVRSQVLQPFASSNMEGLLFIDYYADEVAMAKVRREIRAGKLSGLDDYFEGVSECEKSYIYHADDS